jgi:hypothetical protein
MTWFLLQTGEIHSSTQPADLAASDPKAQEGQSPLVEVNLLRRRIEGKLLSDSETSLMVCATAGGGRIMDPELVKFHSSKKERVESPSQQARAPQSAL